MKGKLTKLETGWSVVAIEEGDWKTYYPLHPADAAEIEADSKRFDNIEARIAAWPDVEFTIEDYWETGLEGVVRVAKLIESDTEYIGDETNEDKIEGILDKALMEQTTYTEEQIKRAWYTLERFDGYEDFIKKLKTT